MAKASAPHRLLLLALPFGWAGPGLASSPGDGSAPSALVAAVLAAGTPAAPQETPPSAPRLRFNFKGQTYDQILDYFSRTTGFPVVRETPVPTGTVDYIYPGEYTLAEALRTLNILLQTQGVLLRVEGERLFLQKLDDMKRENVPTFVGTLPGEITDDQVVTLVLPLLNARALPMAEQLRGLVATYGSVTALEQQNALILVETAAQVRRLQGIIEQLDARDVESVVDVVPLRYAKAPAMLVSLNALMGEKSVEYVIGPDGKRVKLEERKVNGITLTADERTNSLVARGERAKIDQLRDTVALLDVPASEGGASGGGPAGPARTIRTVTLERQTPLAARAKLEQLYAPLPADRKPTIVAFEDTNRVAIIGDPGPVAEGETILRELESTVEPRPGSGGGRRGSGEPERRVVTVLPLAHATPETTIASLRALLSARQSTAITLIPSPDGRAVVVNALPEDTLAVSELVIALDRPTRGEREVRLVRMSERDPEGTIARARELFAEQDPTAEPGRDLRADFDPRQRSLTLVGERSAVERFATLLRTVSDHRGVERETRQLAVRNARPSALAPQLAPLARATLDPRDGTAFVPPEFEAIDELGTLVVTAPPEQFASLAKLVEALDRPAASDFQFRAVPLAGVDPGPLLEKARLVYGRLARAARPGELEFPEVELDRAVGTLLVSGPADSVALYDRALAEARQLMPPARTGKLLPVRQAKAADVAAPLVELLARTAPTDPGRQVAAPTVEVVEANNSLFVTGEAAQLAMVESLLRELDRAEGAALPPLRMLQVRAGDAPAVAAMLSDRYDRRPAEMQREQPVRIEADAVTNALVVSAHPAVFEEIRGFVEEMNRAGDPGTAGLPARETFVFPLRIAKAPDLAEALERLYPLPPVPQDARGRPLPHLQKPKEVYVSADAATNTLIVEAPSERRASFEALVAELDRVQLPPQAELRTYTVARGDPNAVVRTLQDLAARGVLAKPGADGSKPVEVFLSLEPTSRTLIVAGDATTFARVEETLARLEAVPPTRSVRVFESGGIDPARLAERARELYARQSEGVPGAGPVEVETDAANGTLLVTADAEAMARFASIVEQLQSAIAPPPDVRLIPLQFARADEVKETLEGMARNELAVATGPGERPPVLEAIGRTNAMLVAASPRQHEVIAALVRGLDVEGGETPPLRILQLRTADATNLAVALAANYARRSAEDRRLKPVSLSADPQTNTLLVAAHPDLLPEIETIVTQLNDTDAAGSEGREIRIFPLKVARAAELAKTIDEMYPPPPVPVDPRGRPRPELQKPREIVVRADPQVNALIVDAPVQRMPGFERLVEQLDRQQIGADTQIRSYRLLRADAESVANTLRELARQGHLGAAGAGSAAITVTADRVARTVLVAGPDACFPKVEEALAGLDGERGLPPTVLRVYTLKSAKAETIAAMLRQVLAGRIRSDLPEAASEMDRLLEVTPDRRSNTLIISAPSTVMPLAEELIRQLDDGRVSVGDPSIRVRSLVFADASAVAASLTAAASGAVSKATGEPMQVRITAAGGANALLLVGLDADLDEVEALIEPLDARPASDAIDARTFPLRFAKAAQVAPIVQRLLADQQESDPRILMERLRRSRGEIDLVPKVRVEADERTNSLVVSGPQRTVALAETLLGQLDRADEAGARSLVTYTPRNAEPKALAASAKSFLELTRPAGERGTLEVLADAASGTVVAVGTAAEAERARALLERLDGETRVAPPVDLRIVTLRHVDAATAAAALQPLLSDRSRWPESLAAAARSGLAVTEPRVTADPVANRLLISAPAELAGIAETMIAAIDRPRGDDAVSELRVFTLATANAADVARAVQQAFDAKAGSRPAGRRPKVTAEPSSNALLVTAPPEDLAEVDRLVQGLDAGVRADATQVRTVFLRYARADQVAPLVERLLAADDPLAAAGIPDAVRLEALRRRSRDGIPASAEPAVKVAADARLNAVVVSGSGSALNVAEQMVAQLDVEPRGEVRRSVRVLAIENADAAELARTLEEVFREDVGTEVPPTVRVNGPSNSLVVRATDGQFATIERVVGEIDRATIATSRQLRTIPLDPSKADAADVARMLERLLERRGGEGGGVEVIPVEELLRRHGGPAAPTAGGPRSHAPGGIVPAIVAAAFARPDGEADGRDGEGVTIAVDRATNSLVILGSPRAIERARLLAEQAVQELPPEASRIRSIPLGPGTDPERVRGLVAETLARFSPPGGGPGDLARRCALVVDPANRALVVASNDRDFETIGQLIATFARAEAVDRLTMKVYALRNVGADRAARGLRDLLGLGRGERRFRDLAITLERDGTAVETVFDPTQVRAVPDPATNSITVIGPADAIAFVDRYLSFADQAPAGSGAAVRVVPLRHARADAIAGTLATVFRARGRGAGEAGEPTFAADPRTNALVVAAGPEALAEIESLVARLDADAAAERGPLEVIALAHLDATAAAALLTSTVVGEDPERRKTVRIVADPGSGTLLVRAPDAAKAEIRAVLREIDRPAAGEYPVRSIALSRADAGAVATAVQRFYEDRARLAQGSRARATGRRVAVVGDARSGTLLVAASDEDFAEIRGLVERFDSPEAAQSLDFRIYPLEHARAEEIAGIVQAMLGQILWTDAMRGLGRGGREERSSVAVRADERLNALVVTGRGESFALVEQFVRELDAPARDGQRRTVRLHPLPAGDATAVAEILREAIGGAARPGDEAARARILPVARGRFLLVSATERQQSEVTTLLAGLGESLASPRREVAVVSVEFAKASEVASTLNQFLQTRAASAGAASSPTAVLANDGANALVLAGEPEELALLRDLLARLDQPSSAGDRVIEIVPLRDGKAAEIARLVGEQFAGRGGGQGVTVTADVRTNSLIVNAPTAQAGQVKALIAGLDTPDSADETIIRTFALGAAKADEAVRILTETLQLDRSGSVRGVTLKTDDDSPAVKVTARVVADRRSNSLIVTATAESFPVIERLISRLEEVPAASPVEFRVIPLRHAVATEVAFTLRRLVRDRGPGGDPPPTVDASRLENRLIVGATPEQFQLIGQILSSIDVPATRPRQTDFVPLRFAEAEKVRDALSYFYGEYAAEADTPGKRNASIVADPASNSLVISADREEWAGIRELLAKLDSEDYDASLQLKVVPLIHADAESVARAINDAFRRRVDEPVRRAPRTDRENEAPPAPTVLVAGADWVNVSAERQTNSLVISASRMNLAKVEAIVRQLDIAEFDRLPAPRLIPVTIGNPEQLAQAIDRIYAPRPGAGRDAERSRLRIVADAGSNALIIRAPDEEYRQILAIAEALQQQAEAQGLSVRLLTLRSANAGRVAEAIRGAFVTRAEQAKLPLSVQVDPVTNGLVIAATGPLQDEIRLLVEQMDALAPAAGQAIFVIDLANVPPDAAKRVIEEIGLDRPAAAGSAAKVIIDPVKVSAVPGRPSLIVVANPADRETILAFVRALDSEPRMAESAVRIVALRNAAAVAVARTLNELLSSEPTPAASGLAKAMQEQIRRLSVRRDGANQPDLRLDLTQPTRVTADERMNAVILASTPDNLRALEEVARMLDTLPLTAAVQVQIYPLENISSQQFTRILRELFDQGKSLGAIPGTKLAGLPAGVTGKALLSEVVISSDERTNSVIVAGPEDALALVEVLKTRLDNELGVGWVEPRLIPLRWADADLLASTLQSVLVEGKTVLPESTPMQRQVGRIRMARGDGNAGGVVDSDVFVPMGQLVIRPEPQLNALLVVGSRGNVAIVTELVRQLDVEAASPSALVRVYPLENASAARIATLSTQLFEQQRAGKVLRDEDRLRAIADERTNSLIVSTSPRSFAIFEELLKTLDRKLAPDIKEIRIVELRNASAARLAPMVQTLMDARLERLRRVQPETADLERVTVVSDGRANALVVAAGADAFGVIESLVRDLDREETRDQGLLQAIPLRKANLDRVAAALNQIMERRYADLPVEVVRRAKPLILTDPRTSSLLVSAAPEDLKAIQDLVEKLEATPANPAVGVEVIALASGRADLMAPRIEQLMKERTASLGPSREPSDAVAIVPDVTSNSLIVAASPENVAVIRELAAVLADAAAKAVGGQAFEIVSLARGRASEIVALLDDLYLKEENRRRGANTVAAAAEERINAVILSGSEVDLAAMRRMVAQLDSAKPNSVVEIKYIPLASANVLETVNLIQTVLSGTSLGGGRNQQQAIVLKYLRQLGGEDGTPEEPIELEVSAALRQAISLTPDVRTNTIIVRAPRESMELIERMIRDLDGSTAGAQNIRIFRLANADAEQMARVLTDLFNLRQQGNLYVLRPREPRVGTEPGATDGSGDLGGTELSLVPDERQALAITVDNRTNSLLVSGTPNYLDLVAKVVNELDATEATARDTFVYRLKNAQAPEVARVLNDFVAKDQQKVLSMLSPEERPSAQKLLEQEVTIVGDQASNSVLVNASPRYMDRVKSVIGELDIDPPQVQIQVLLAEITLSSSTDLGLEFTRFQIGDVDVAGGFGLNKQSFAAGSPRPPGLVGLAPALFGSVAVPNIAIGSQDFDLLLNALAAQGRVELLSNPSVMVANNTEGRIQVGDTVRLPTSVSFSAAGQQSAVEPEEVGVILVVTPSINPDGFVRMKIEPEISRISKETTQISENFESPIINRRKATTTVTVRDGQTVVIGGLVQDRYERIEKKIPLLGDLPLVGMLFRNYSESTAKTELLIVLTPHVMTNEKRAGELSEKMIEKLSVPPELLRQIRQGELEGVVGTLDREGRLVTPIGAPSEPSKVDAPQVDPDRPAPAPKGSQW